MSSPLNKIENGYIFQQIVAEYFRALKGEKLDYSISDVQVHENGVGSDDGCDILVEFLYEDAIYHHSHRWIIECKSQKRAVNAKDINTNNIETLLKSKSAIGYLLVCKFDATTSLRRIFDDFNKRNGNKYIIWNGSQLWHKLIKHLRLIEAFFPEYYQEYYKKNNAEKNYADYVKEYQEKLNTEKQ